MSELVFDGLFAPPLNGAELRLGPGLHVILGSEADGTGVLIELIAGVSAARRGSVRVAGRDPRTTPPVRQRIGAVLAEEQAPPAKTVADVLTLVGRAGNDRNTSERLLDELDLRSWTTRSIESLSAYERRTLALVLALGLENPAVLALHEPLLLAPSRRGRLLERLIDRASQGAVVVCATASTRDAAELGGSVFLLEHGRFVRRPGQPLALELAPGTMPYLRVQCADARRLASELIKDPSVVAVEWRYAEPGGELVVRGVDPEAVSLNVARAARSTNTAVMAMQYVLPQLDAVRGASDGLARAAFETAQRAAYEAARRHQLPQSDAPPAAEGPPQSSGSPS
jgi:ABC-type multidrug transport system ATPase subunit